MIRPIRHASAALLLSCGLAACAGTPPPGPAPVANAPRYTCPDGTSFTTSTDPATLATSLFLNNQKPQVLLPVPDPMGGHLAQNANYQLRPGLSDTTQFLTDRSTTVQQACTRG
ncbi:hypothetical protein NFI95_02280 [Acetobacteraceae bacterium KSS8]|uniref:C-type lysozyme inhibitor domain-containing protein n=1 Tax=Endosaccharibacter trunci TaxID=2812733 RepID=A0ABT1W4S9_9PROT|nr:hypothetical protein [Acetobacteraceae bacterium KSS8]